MNVTIRHFNAAALSDAAAGYRELIASGGRMLMTLAGAMSTAEIGVSLAEMIRQEKIHAISCTGANLEEDLFNLVAHDEYLRIPNYRDLTPEAEQDLFDRSFNRVTDTCIPEKAAMLRLDHAIRELWYQAESEGKSFLPHEYVYQLLRSRTLADSYQIDPRDSWVVAACEKDLPLFVPGWEDSTLGNVFASYCIKGTIKNPQTVRGGIEYMVALADWYRETSREAPIGFFQIGGGIAGDFAICVGPHAQARSEVGGHAALELLLPDQRFGHQLRLLLGGRSQRKDYLGQAGSGHPPLRDRIGRHHRGPPDLRLRAGTVTFAGYSPTTPVWYSTCFVPHEAPVV